MGKNSGRIVMAQNLSTILPQFFPAALRDEGLQNLSTIIPQFFPDGCLPYKGSKDYMAICGRIVKEFGACQIREGFSFLRLTRISRGKAGKCVWGTIIE
jgi:hypothetical protein